MSFLTVGSLSHLMLVNAVFPSRFVGHGKVAMPVALGATTDKALVVAGLLRPVPPGRGVENHHALAEIGEGITLMKLEP